MNYTLEYFDKLLEKDNEEFEAFLKDKKNKKIIKARAEDRTLLLQAVRRGVVDKVGLLLNHGADIHHEDKLGYTPLHYAVNNNITLINHLPGKDNKDIINDNVILKLTFSGADPERRSNLKKYSAGLNVFEFIQEEKKGSDQGLANYLDTVKEKILLARIIFLTEKVLAEYEKSHQGLFSSKIDPQRLKLVKQIRTKLGQIKTNLEKEQSIEEINSQTAELLDMLKDCEQAAEQHHKKNGTLMFFGHGLTSSSLAKALHKVTLHSIVKHFQKLSPKLEEISHQDQQQEKASSSVMVLLEEREVVKTALKITEIVDALKKKYDLSETDVNVVQEALLQLESLDLFNDNTIEIIFATPTQEFAQKILAVLKWIRTKPFMQIDYKTPEELQEIYKTKIALECKNKCFELIWSHPEEGESLSRGIQALYFLKTFSDNRIDIFQVSYLDFLGKYPHGALEIGSYLFQNLFLIDNDITFRVSNGEYITVDQQDVDAMKLNLELALSRADKETQNDIFYFLSFHRGQNSHYKIKQEHFKYAKSLAVTLRILSEDKEKKSKNRMFPFYDFDIMNDLVHQFPKHAKILMEEVVAYMSMKKEADETKDAQLDQMKMFFASLQQKLALNCFNPKSENTGNLVHTLKTFLMDNIENLNETQQKSFSDVLKEFQEELLKADRVDPLTELCIRYIKANSFFNCQNLNGKLNLNQLPDELKQHFVPVTESKKAP